MARDSQRSKLYQAELVLKEVPVSSMWAATAGMARATPTVPQMQAYVDLLLRQRWFQARWGQREIEVHDGRGRRRAFGGAGRVLLPHWARSERMTLHEVAHVLDRSGGHGPAYAGLLVTLVRHTMGVQAARLLRASFREKRVRVSMDNVPDPSAARVITQAAAAERRAQARVEPVMASTVQRSAEIVRRLVAQGHFGPPGRRPRAQALTVARRLEEIVRLSPPMISQESVPLALAAKLRKEMKPMRLDDPRNKPDSGRRQGRAKTVRVYLCDRGHEHRSEDAMHACENNPSAKTRKGR